MGRWIEMVCDRCAVRGPGRNVTRSAWHLVEKEARRRGWLVELSVSSVRYLCPNCRRRPTDA